MTHREQHDTDGAIFAPVAVAKRNSAFGRCIALKANMTPDPLRVKDVMTLLTDSLISIISG